MQLLRFQAYPEQQNSKNIPSIPTLKKTIRLIHPLYIPKKIINSP